MLPPELAAAEARAMAGGSGRAGARPPPALTAELSTSPHLRRLRLQPLKIGAKAAYTLLAEIVAAQGLKPDFLFALLDGRIALPLRFGLGRFLSAPPPDEAAAPGKVRGNRRWDRRYEAARHLLIAAAELRRSRDAGAIAEWVIEALSMAPGQRGRQDDTDLSSPGATLLLRNLMPETVLLPLPNGTRRMMLPGRTVAVPAAAVEEFTLRLLVKHRAILQLGGPKIPELGSEEREQPAADLAQAA